MKFYIEITLLQNQEISFFDLYSKLFTQIHLGLVEMKDEKEQSPIGISFPKYRFDAKAGLLGDKLRLFAQEESILAKFDIAKWLSRLSDYVHYTAIRAVPDKINNYAIYQRHQPKTNKERLARRYAKRNNLDYNNALIRYETMEYKTIIMPFIRLKSLGSNRDFCLWIKKTATNQPNYQKFSTYGLSSVSTLPEF